MFIYLDFFLLIWLASNPVCLEFSTLLSSPQVAEHDTLLRFHKEYSSLFGRAQERMCLFLERVQKKMVKSFLEILKIDLLKT